MAICYECNCNFRLSVLCEILPDRPNFTVNLPKNVGLGRMENTQDIVL